MKTEFAKPPMYDDIVAAFPDAAGPGVIFCWGDTMYVPRKVLGAVPPELVAHENVHCIRQGSDVAGWWRRYLVDEAFRLQEEFPAHAAEFRAMCEMHRYKWNDPRAMRRVFAGRIGAKLAAPLYGSMIAASQARSMLIETARIPAASWDAFIRSGMVEAVADAG